MPTHSITNQKIINTLREIALYLRATDVPFKPQAYETAAEGIAGLESELADMYKRCGKKCIKGIPGVGESIAEKIEEIVTTGRLEFYAELKKKYPFDMLALTNIQEVGPKTALKLYKELGVKTVNDLQRACKANIVEKVEGLGHKSEQKIMRGIAFLKSNKGRRIIHDVLPLARHIVERLEKIDGVTHVDITGSLRRRKETIGDIDLVATTSKPRELIAAFKAIPEVSRVLESGNEKIAVRYNSGILGDLLILPPESYGAALLHFTGSREHNILLRELAISKKMKLSEHGLFKGNKCVASKTEESIYKALGLVWIPPELRIGADEIEAAKNNEIPDLIPYGSIKGDLQIQSSWTDGTASIDEMARAAKKYGLSYMAVTDHTKALAMTHGLDEKRLRAQGREIDKLNKKLRGFTILKSTECDILKDGRLDLRDDALRALDLVTVSVHTFFEMPEREMTARIIAAIKHPLVNILLHPTGRVVGRRAPYKIEMDRVMRAAKDFGVALEINGSERLDLHEQYIREAIKQKVKLVISSDAHDPSHYVNLEHGIAQARKGWARKADILNTKPCDQLLKALKRV
jgi:DNA polymerase (family 10)